MDFTASNTKKESKRLFSVKAMSDMDLLILEKEDLYQIDLEFKKEVLLLFSESYLELKKLKKMLRRGHHWLRENQSKKEDGNTGEDEEAKVEEEPSEEEEEAEDEEEEEE